VGGRGGIGVGSGCETATRGRVLGPVRLAAAKLGSQPGRASRRCAEREPPRDRRRNARAAGSATHNSLAGRRRGEFITLPRARRRSPTPDRSLITDLPPARPSRPSDVRMGGSDREPNLASPRAPLPFARSRAPSHPLRLTGFRSS
jgi:hypothetical protein